MDHWEGIQLRLEMIAAEAKLLATQRIRLYHSDIQNTLRSIRTNLDRIEQDVRYFEAGDR